MKSHLYIYNQQQLNKQTNKQKHLHVNLMKGGIIKKNVVLRNNYCKTIQFETMQAYVCWVFYLVGYHPFEHVNHLRCLHGLGTQVGSSYIFLPHHLRDCP